MNQLGYDLFSLLTSRVYKIRKERVIGPVLYLLLQRVSACVINTSSNTGKSVDLNHVFREASVWDKLDFLPTWLACDEYFPDKESLLISTYE
jgi:hypothetical protein